ncbi:hypothetical protein PHMEG_00033032 [Phytophthora megakarya]|uniref:Cysteine-rich protein n=1 Tax=Phytophthora megakarya TaxID=4795 RepID=A0A225UU88_9STRA|nr:hypothetical protein PHMEG_00033032 [Phytophthora megakarya]
MHLVSLLAFASSLTASCSNAEAIQGLNLNATQPPVARLVVKNFVHVVADGDDCDFQGKTLPMCANKNFVCRMKPGQEMFAIAPSCLLYDPNNMQDNPYENEENSVAPWENCNPTAELKRKIRDPPICQRDFTCLCLHGAGKSCVCVPPDAVDDENGASQCNGMSTCGEDEYCHYLREGGMECGQKPYYS